MLELPDEMKPWVFTDTQAERFNLDEFLDRVAKREGTDIETALQHARAVFFALGSALSPEALAHMASILGRDFDPLMAEAQRRDVEIMLAASSGPGSVSGWVSTRRPRARSPRRSRRWPSGSPPARWRI